MKLIAALPVLIAFLVGALPAHAWTWPVAGPVLQPFEFEGDPYAAGQHRGVDVGAPPGTPVLAPATGVVSFAGSVPRNGLTATIATADGYAVTLVHLGSVSVARGAPVEEGAAIGTIGPSGEAEHAAGYVHVGIRLAGDPHGYLDPLSLLPALPAPPPIEDTAPGGDLPAEEPVEEGGAPAEPGEPEEESPPPDPAVEPESPPDPGGEDATEETPAETEPDSEPGESPPVPAEEEPAKPPAEPELESPEEPAVPAPAGDRRRTTQPRTAETETGGGTHGDPRVGRSASASGEQPHPPAWSRADVPERALVSRAGETREHSRPSRPTAAGKREQDAEGSGRPATVLIAAALTALGAAVIFLRRRRRVGRAWPSALALPTCTAAARHVDTEGSVAEKEASAALDAWLAELLSPRAPCLAAVRVGRPREPCLQTPARREAIRSRGVRARGARSARAGSALRAPQRRS